MPGAPRGGNWAASPLTTEGRTSRVSKYGVRPAPPSADPRWKMVDATMRKLGYRSDALIEALHTVQENFGYLDPQSLRYVAACLRQPLSRVFGVATFYHFFSLKPKGRHCCIVCTGTACYIKGAGEVLAALEERFGVKSGETSRDGLLSVATARCLGACGAAPAVVFDQEMAGKVTPAQALERVEEWQKHAVN